MTHNSSKQSIQKDINTAGPIWEPWRASTASLAVPAPLVAVRTSRWPCWCVGWIVALCHRDGVCACDERGPDHLLCAASSCSELPMHRMLASEHVCPSSLCPTCTVPGSAGRGAGHAEHGARLAAPRAAQQALQPGAAPADRCRLGGPASTACPAASGSRLAVDWL